MSEDKPNKDSQDYIDSFDAMGRELPPAFPLSIRFGVVEDICCLLYTSDAADEPPLLCRSRWSPYH